MFLWRIGYKSLFLVWRRLLTRYAHKYLLPRLGCFYFRISKNKPPSHTTARKQSSLLATQKNTGISSSVFLCTAVCGLGESNSRPIVGNDMLYHLTKAAYIYFNSFSVNSTHRINFRFKTVLPIIVFPVPLCNVLIYWLKN